MRVEAHIPKDNHERAPGGEATHLRAPGPNHGPGAMNVMFAQR